MTNIIMSAQHRLVRALPSGSAALIAPNNHLFGVSEELRGVDAPNFSWTQTERGERVVLDDNVLYSGGLSPDEMVFDRLEISRCRANAFFMLSDMRFPTLSRLVVRKSALQRTDFGHIVMDEYSSGDFTDVNLYQARLSGQFRNVTFKRVDFLDANISGVTFINCVFDQCDLSRMTAFSANFVNCTVRRSCIAPRIVPLRPLGRKNFALDWNHEQAALRTVR